MGRSRIHDGQSFNEGCTDIARLTDHLVTASIHHYSHADAAGKAAKAPVQYADDKWNIIDNPWVEKELPPKPPSPPRRARSRSPRSGDATMKAKCEAAQDDSTDEEQILTDVLTDVSKLTLSSLYQVNHAVAERMSKLAPK